MTAGIIQLSLVICSVLLASSAPTILLYPSTGDVTKPLIKCISLTPDAYKCKWDKEPEATYTFEHRNLPKGNWKQRTLQENDTKAYVVGTGNQEIRVNATNSIGSASLIITYDVKLHLKPNITYTGSTMTATSATLSWTTEDIYRPTEFFESQVAYEEYDYRTNETGEMIELNRTRQTTMTIDGLKPGRSYRFYIRSRYDRAGNNFTEWTYVGKNERTKDIENRACFQPKDPGYGRFIYTRWYYDAGDMICKPFNYLGSHGNSNRFRSYKKCSSYCNSRCYQHIPNKQNSACDGGGFEWAYNQGRRECLPFRNSSCHSPDYSYNRFKTKRECERDCKYYGVEMPEPPYICPRINTRESICNSHFIVSGKVSSISLEIYSEYLVHRLVVEVTQVHMGRDLLPLYSVNNTHGTKTEFLHIKKILVDGRSCHNTVTATTYVFMGNIHFKNALIDDASYVKQERPSVLSKINVHLNRPTNTCWNRDF